MNDLNPILIQAAIGIPMALLSGWLMQLGCKLIFLEKDTNNRVYFGKTMWGVSILGIAMSSALLYFLEPAGFKEHMTFICLAVADASAIYVLSDCAFTRGHFDSKKLIYRTLWKGRRELFWSDLLEIRESLMLGVYILEFTSGKAYVSVAMRGHRKLVECAIEKL